MSITSSSSSSEESREINGDSDKDNDQIPISSEPIDNDAIFNQLRPLKPIDMKIKHRVKEVDQFEHIKDPVEKMVYFWRKEFYLRIAQQQKLGKRLDYPKLESTVGILTITAFDIWFEFVTKHSKAFSKEDQHSVTEIINSFVDNLHDVCLTNGGHIFKVAQQIVKEEQGLKQHERNIVVHDILQRLYVKETDQRAIDLLFHLCGQKNIFALHTHLFLTLALWNRCFISANFLLLFFDCVNALSSVAQRSGQIPIAIEAQNHIIYCQTTILFQMLISPDQKTEHSIVQEITPKIKKDFASSLPASSSSSSPIVEGGSCELQ